jgi:hypothetical protein
MRDRWSMPRHRSSSMSRRPYYAPYAAPVYAAPAYPALNVNVPLRESRPVWRTNRAPDGPSWAVPMKFWHA